jgi:hypothetical protein
VTRFVGLAGMVLVLAWVTAHVAYLGPVREAGPVTLVWALVLTGAAGLVAAASVLLWGVLLGRTTPAWMRFARTARTAAATIGAGLAVVGLLHYRQTEPAGELQWLVTGLALLAAAALVHWWISRAARDALT